MITDRISLNLAYIYLERFQAIEGTLSNIVFRKTLYDDNTTKLETSFASLSTFKSWIDLNAPIKPFEDLECFPLAIYELIKFDVIKSITNKNTIVSNNRTYETNSSNINSASLELLNTNYMLYFLKTLSEFNQLKLDEYILVQREYIDCKYIQVYFQNSLDKLLQLYKDYKNRTT